MASGPAFSRSEMTPGGLLGLEAGFPVAAPLPAQGHIQPKELPGGDAARAVHMGEYVDIPKTRIALLQWVLELGARTRWSGLVMLRERSGSSPRSCQMANRHLLAVATHGLIRKPGAAKNYSPLQSAATVRRLLA